MKFSKNNKNMVMLAVLLIAVLIMIGTSYALWQITLQQTDTNVITSGCFKVSFKDNNPINLQNAFPITDDEGKKLIPYQFTLTNNCSSYANYQVNLEVLDNTTISNDNYIKMMLQEKKLILLTSNDLIDVTLNNAVKSYKLETGFLSENEEKTFNLRLWLDEETPTTEEVMNKIFNSKVTIITSHQKNAPTFSEAVTTCGNNGYDAKTCMLENSKYDTTNLIKDGTVDDNLRFVGKNPDNYVLFNGQKWRIIGVMNNIEGSDGTKDSRIKLLSKESVGKMSWNASSQQLENGLEEGNMGVGLNEWSQADMMKVLNPGYESEVIGGSLYWNKQSGTCYYGENNATTACDFTVTGLNEESKSYIDNVVWNTGSNTVGETVDTLTPNTFYQAERSDKGGKQCDTSHMFCTDKVDRTTKWTGRVGLMYPSDFGYATSGSTTTPRNTCINTSMRKQWQGKADCYNNDWIFDGVFHWTMMPYADPSVAAYVIRIWENADLMEAASGFGNGYGQTHPAIYLKPSTMIKSGTGTFDDPYILSQ